MAKKDAPTWYPAKDEKNVFGYFALYPILDIPASKSADEERTKEVLVLHTRTAGDPDTPAPMKVHPHNQMEFVRRFPDAWAAYKGETVLIGGTPLDALKLTDQKLMELSIYAITRLEHLAAISDQQCESMGFGTKKLRSEAQRLLAEAGKPVPAPTAEERTQEIAAAVTAATTAPEAKAAFDMAVAEAVAKALAARPAESAHVRRKTRGPNKPRAKAPAAEPVAA